MFLEVFIIGFFVAFVALAALATHLLTAGVSRLWIRIPVMAVLAAGFMLFFVADILQGRWWLNHACQTEGGLHIYQKVDLGPEYWREDGSPKYINITGTALERGNFNSEVFENKYFQDTDNYSYENYSRINVRATRIIDKSNNQALGEVKILFYQGGRLAFMFGDFAGQRCPRDRGLYTQLYTGIFIKKI